MILRRIQVVLSQMFLSTLFILLPASLISQEVSWHDLKSPYRVELEILSQPNHQATGYWLEIPICNLSFSNGEDVIVYTSKGDRLPRISIGPTHNNSALILCGGNLPNGTRLFAYLGSRQKQTDSESILPGLYVTIYRLPLKVNLENWEECQRLLEKAPRIGVQPMSQVNLADNPFTEDDTFAMEFYGYFLANSPEELEIFLACDDAGFIFLPPRKQPVFEYPGFHGGHENARGEKRSKIRLQNRLTPFRIVVLDGGGDQLCTLGQYIPGKGAIPFPSSKLLLAGHSRVIQAQTRDPQKGCPLFRTSLLHYYGHPQLGFLTAFRVASLTGEPLSWTVENGQKGYSSIFEQIIVGTNPVKIMATTKDNTQAQGLILLKPIPKRNSWDDQSMYSWYSTTMLAQSLDNLNPEYLKTYLEFFQLKERNPNSATVAAYLLRNPDKNLLPIRKLHTIMVQCGGTVEIQQTHQSWLWLTQNVFRNKQVKNALSSEELELNLQGFFDFELYAHQSQKESEHVLNLIGQFCGIQSLLYRRCNFEFLLLQKKHDEALKILQSIEQTAQNQYTFRTIALANSYLTTLEEWLKQEALSQATEALYRWISYDPTRLADGYYAYQKARLLSSLGWKQGALQLLEHTLAILELPAWLPDIQYFRAMLLKELGRTKEAKQLFEKIIQSYPNHPKTISAQQILHTFSSPE